MTFLNLDKSFGWTSHDCVAKVRKLLREKRVGHAGTLDPAATGVLPIALGKATRLLQYLPGDKAYKATVRFGVRTATDDLEGEVIAQQAVGSLSSDSVAALLPNFLGKIEQIPPMYSAIQVEGKRLYDLARKGEKVDVPVRTVEIFEINVLDWREGDFPELDISIACGSGTYIRAIARDLGEMLSVGGTLASLQRTRSSGFNLESSLSIDELGAQLQAGSFQPIASDAPLAYLPQIILAANESKRWCQGQRLICEEEDKDKVRVYADDGNFLGVGQIINGVLSPLMVFANQ